MGLGPGGGTLDHGTVTGNVVLPSAVSDAGPGGLFAYVRGGAGCGAGKMGAGGAGGGGEATDTGAEERLIGEGGGREGGEEEGEPEFDVGSDGLVKDVPDGVETDGCD